MSGSASEPKKSFVVSPQITGSSQQPLELYHLSHDLRGPLNSVLGFCELLLEGLEGPLNENQETDIAAIYQSAQNLLQLISSLVDLSKLEAGRLNFDTSNVDLGPVLQKIMDFDFGTNKPEQVELIAHVPDGLPPLSGDRGRIEQMIMNLVRFAFRRKNTGQVVLSADSDEQTVTIQVDIDQLDLSSTQLAELFELAVHTDAAGRSELGLGGLELPLVRALAEAHQGQVWAESAAGTSTTLYLKLPSSQ
jgi:signal transduction histidine kinase